MWINILPLQEAPASDDILIGNNTTPTNKTLKSNVEHLNKYNLLDPEKVDKVMLNRNRLSRILFLRKFFYYPISLNYNTLSNLGINRTFKIGLSYIKSSFWQITPEKSLEDFFINRFGVELYHTFFKDYTKKVWGVACSQITAEWGSQRIKGLSIKKAIINAFKNLLTSDMSISQKDVETSLIGQFLYPKYGPGQLWEEVAKQIIEGGGEIHQEMKVTGISNNKNGLDSVTVLDVSTGNSHKIEGDYFLSTMPVKELINAFEEDIPSSISEVAQGLMYRDFITVGLLLNKLKIKNETKFRKGIDLVPDNWIYIQERDVKIGRLQIFNN